jgi:hypothetical protein
LDTEKRPLSPCHPARARKLLTEGKAAVFRRYPFTIILKRVVTDAQADSLRLKIDPGSKTTGLGLSMTAVAPCSGRRSFTTVASGFMIAC